MKDEIRSVGLKYQLATKFTSFVGVDQQRAGSLWQGGLVTRQVHCRLQSPASFHPHSRSQANYQPIVVDFLDVSSKIKCCKLLELHLLHLLELLLHLVVDILPLDLQVHLLELLEVPWEPSLVELPLLALLLLNEVDQHLIHPKS